MNRKEKFLKCVPRNVEIRSENIPKSERLSPGSNISVHKCESVTARELKLKKKLYRALHVTVFVFVGVHERVSHLLG